MLRFLVVLTLLLTAADHWTTYLCLRAPIPGWHVTEANPIADWLFTSVGLVPGIMVDSLVTILALGLLVGTALIPRPAKALFFCLIIAWTGYAVVNNFQAIHTMGLSPLGAA